MGVTTESMRASWGVDGFGADYCFTITLGRVVLCLHFKCPCCD